MPFDRPFDGSCTSNSLGTVVLANLLKLLVVLICGLAITQRVLPLAGIYRADPLKSLLRNKRVSWTWE